MKQSKLLSLEEEFKKVIPSMTIQNTETDQQRRDRFVSNLQYQMSFAFQKKLDLYFSRKPSMSTSCRSSHFLIYAFCLSNDENLSTIELRMYSKVDQRSIEKKFQSIYLCITSMKIMFNRKEELRLILGTKCGKILEYKNFQLEQIDISSVKVSAHPLVSILIPSFEEAVFVLSENGTIYLVDLLKNQVLYQFQTSLPLIEDKNLHLFMDEGENHVCCAFGHGRILFWEIDQNIKQKLRLASKSANFWVEEEPSSKITTNKESSYRQTIFRYKTSFISCSEEGIKSIGFLGQYILLVTNDNVLKVIAVNLSEKTQNYELYLVLKEFSLLKPGQIYEGQELHQEIPSIVYLPWGIFYCINTWSKDKQKFISCRIEVIEFQNDLLPQKIKIDLPFGSPVQEVTWNVEERFMLCRSQDRYFLCCQKKLEEKSL